MALSEKSYTHKGWIGLCPVWLADIDTDCPYVWPRYGLGILLTISELIFGAMNWLRSLVNSEFEPTWPILITGELRRPKVISYDC